MMERRTTAESERNKILALFPIPLYTGTHIYFEDDLDELGLTDVFEDMTPERKKTIYAHAETLAQIKPELAFHFLMTFTQLLKVIPLEDLGKWVHLVLDIYDSEGMNPAREFILGLDRHPLFHRFWGSGLSLGEVTGILSNYLQALGKDDLKIETDADHYTDFEAIYLPERSAFFPDRHLNFILYKVMVTHKFAQLKLGTYGLGMKNIHGLLKDLEKRYGGSINPNVDSELTSFFHLFPELDLIEDLFNITETLRIERWMAKVFPGLFRQLGTLKKHLALIRAPSRGMSPREKIMEKITLWLLSGGHLEDHSTRRNEGVGSVLKVLKKAHEFPLNVETSAGVAAEAYILMDEVPGPYKSNLDVPYIGRLKPEEAERGRRRRRESIKNRFRSELARLVGELPECEEVRIEAPAVTSESLRKGRIQRQQIPDVLQINAHAVPMPEAMKKIIKEIYEDLGALPASYLAVTDEMSGHHFRSLCRMPEGTGYVLSEHGEGVHVIDEWDHRRQGYRKRWVLLKEMQAPEGDTAFAEETMERYGSIIRQIKRQFERIQLKHAILRRQTDGDHIDLDAAVEAFVDQKAGLPPSDRLFMHRMRDKRDIAVAFLIDLSGSTGGWINEMERAALLILSEAMQVLRDRFAIYGFSGRTRKRCELYCIKGFEEAYGREIQGRISHLKALEYTRMGPPIRRVARVLGDMDAKTRLLITLSDGKPDDYDGYKGDYGIEDTKQALLEAKNSGIHPFCITIDKAEHGYISHMYGDVNYIFIDDLSKLPVKIPEIYRKLTS